MHTVQCTFTDKSFQSIDRPIVFPFINSNRVILPHEDALVLILGVDGFDIRRIMINLGSFTDILEMSTYRQMEYFSFILENLGHILTNFNKASTVFLGDVVLPIQVKLVTLNIRFSMVGDLSPYNALIRWV